MAKLKAAARNKMPAEKFGLPGSRKYPMPDKGHAVDAKGRATQQVNKGKMSKATEAKIDAKADKIIGKGKAPAKPPVAHDEENMVPGKRGHFQYT